MRANRQEAASIPIVQSNPKNILGLKAAGEQALRGAGLPYAIVRPCGVSDFLPEGRVVVASGDTATGSISRAELAALMARLLSEPAATCKTLETFSLPGLPPRPLAPVRRGPGSHACMCLAMRVHEEMRYP